MKSIFYLILFVSTTVFSQQFIKHKVVLGESVYSIAKKYKVTQNEIFEKNPSAKASLALNSILLIPNNNLKSESKINLKSDQKNTIPTFHKVIAKETLFGISKKHKISISALEILNPNLKLSGLKTGMNLNLLDLSKNENSIKTNEIFTKNTYVILPKDTKYKIAKKFNLSISELENLNPKLPSDFPVGYVLKLTQNATTEITEEPKPEFNKSIDLSSPNKSTEEKANLTIAKASEFLGVKYKSGGTNNEGFDCSGLILTTFEAINLKLPRTSSEQANFGQTITKENAQKGDLIFFKTNGSSTINHVGLITEVSTEVIKFIHASSSAGVMVSSLSEDYYATRFEKINRVIE